MILETAQKLDNPAELFQVVKIVKEASSIQLIGKVKPAKTVKLHKLLILYQLVEEVQMVKLTNAG